MSDTDPSYEEMTEWVRVTEIDLGASQNAYANDGAMGGQWQQHPDANLDGFIPPDEEEGAGVDWNDVLSLGAVPSYEPDEAERRAVADDLDLGLPDDPAYEGAPKLSREDIEAEPSHDPRYEFRDLVVRWPHLADVFYAIMMAIDSNDAEPIGEDIISLDTLRCADGSNRWYVDDILEQHLFVQHDPSMNHPLSSFVRDYGDYVVWVYERDKPENFPHEPAGYIHNGNVFRRPKVRKKA